MKVTGTRGYIHIDDGEKVAWFGGEMGIDGFYAVKSSMRWLPPHDNLSVSEDDIETFVKKVEEDLPNHAYKVFFL